MYCECLSVVITLDSFVWLSAGVLQLLNIEWKYEDVVPLQDGDHGTDNSYETDKRGPQNHNHGGCQFQHPCPAEMGTIIDINCGHYADPRTEPRATMGYRCDRWQYLHKVSGIGQSDPICIWAYHAKIWQHPNAVWPTQYYTHRSLCLQHEQDNLQCIRHWAGESENEQSILSAGLIWAQHQEYHHPCQKHRQIILTW